MTERSTQKTADGLTFSGAIGYADAVVLESAPLEAIPATNEPQEMFTRETFEGALDKVSRPTSRGKYAHLPYSSEDFIRDKKAEVELEDR